MQFIRILKKDFQKAFSFVFLFSVGTIFSIILLCSSFDLFYLKLQYANVLTILCETIFMNKFNYIYFILAIIPSIGIYSQEVKTGNVIFSYNRVKRKYYLISKGIVSFVIAFLVILIPFLILYIFLIIILPIDFNDNNVAILKMLNVNNTLEYFALTITAKGLNVAFYASVSLIAVNICNNIFVISSIPIILHLAISRICSYLSIPDMLSPVNLGSVIGISGNFTFKIAYISLYFIFLSAIAITIFVYQSLKKEV